MKPDLIIDSHTHWGPSISMGIDVTSSELNRQKDKSGIDYVVIIPFPSTAIANNAINVELLDESKKVKHFIPYHYIRENYDTEGFDPVPGEYYGGKWHWMRGWQDSASNYKVLQDSVLPELAMKIQKTNKPVIFEEELEFTIRFVEMFPGITIIIPHLGMLGGYPLQFLEAFKKSDSVYFDTALGPRDTILEFVQTIGPERILFGSDVPFGTIEGELSKIMTLPIGDSERNLVLYENFIRLTGFTPGKS